MAFTRIATLFLSLLLPSLAWCPTEPSDSYSVYLKTTWRMALRWQEHPSGKEVEAFAWKTWEASGEERIAETMTCVAVLENQLRYIENEAGMGYVGGTWATIQKSFKGTPLANKQDWFKRHPWEVHQRLVARFKGFEETCQDPEKALRVWHRGGKWDHSKASRQDADRYVRNWAIVYNQYYRFKDEISPRPAYQECEVTDASRNP